MSQKYAKTAVGSGRHSSYHKNNAEKCKRARFSLTASLGVTVKSKVLPRARFTYALVHIALTLASSLAGMLPNLLSLSSYSIVWRSYLRPPEGVVEPRAIHASDHGVRSVALLSGVTIFSDRSVFLVIAARAGAGDSGEGERKRGRAFPRARMQEVDIDRVARG